MRRVVWTALLVAIVSFLVWSKDPLNDTVNFLIAGSIPGTSLSVGFWSTMAIVAVLFLIIRRAAKNARHKMIALEIEKTKAKKSEPEFEESNTIEFDHSKRSVIAARKSEPAL